MTTLASKVINGDKNMKNPIVKQKLSYVFTMSQLLLNTMNAI